MVPVEVGQHHRMDLLGLDIKHHQLVEHRATLRKTQARVEEDVLVATLDKECVDGRLRLARGHQLLHHRRVSLREEVHRHPALHILKRPHLKTVELIVVHPCNYGGILHLLGFRGRFVLFFVRLATGQNKQGCH